MNNTYTDVVGLFARRSAGREQRVSTTTIQHVGVLGTDLTGVITHLRPRPRQEGQRLLARIDELEDVFSMYRPKSMLCRWCDESLDLNEGSPELDWKGKSLLEVLERAQHWNLASSGAFNPAVGLASRIWDRAATAGSAPTDEELHRAAVELATPRFRVNGNTVLRFGDCGPVNLNAIAKGYIADRCAEFLWDQPGTMSVVVNLGGDLVHRGSGSHRVAIQNPLRPFDNEPPLFRLRISNAAVATSGSSVRGWQIAGTWHSHVIDPRTARPVATISSASVVAPKAIDADALATVFSVIGEEERSAFGATLPPDIAYCVVDSSGAAIFNEMWQSLLVEFES